MARRTTHQRKVTQRILRESKAFLTAQELHARIREVGERVGLATVYRALDDLAEQGEADVVRDAEGVARYRMCEETEHHHHLRCRSCNTSVELKDASVERWATRAARRHGFAHVSHEVELSGVCRTCRSEDR